MAIIHCGWNSYRNFIAIHYLSATAERILRIFPQQIIAKTVGYNSGIKKLNVKIVRILNFENNETLRKNQNENWI